MSEHRIPLAWQARFSPAELERIAQGLIPEEMEDKWFIFQEGDRVFLHRSWTGLAVFEVRLEGDQVAQAWLDGDSVENETDETYWLQTLEFLFQGLLLGKPAAAPVSSGVPPQLQGPARFSAFGHGASKTPRNPLSPDRAGLELSRQRLEDTGCEALAYGAKDTGEMGGGVASVVLTLAGPQLRDGLRERLAETDRKVGTAVWTPPFGLAERGVLGVCHIVSIIKNTPQGAWCPEPDKLARGVLACLEGCRDLHLHSVALASLGTGEGRVEPSHAARLMIGAARDYRKKNPDWPLRIVFALPTPRDYAAFAHQLSR